MNFNISPYFDDYDKKKGFYRILYRPGYPVQARELTQMQTILQEQITRLGDHFFTSGDKIIGGDLVVTPTKYIKLESGDVADKIGTKIYFYAAVDGVSTLVLEGTVQAVAEKTDEDPATLYVSYNPLSTTKLELSPGDSFKFYDNTAGTVLSDADSVGDALITEIKDGIFYLKNHFVFVEHQVEVVGKYTLYPSARVGLKVVESVVTPEEDTSLLDNARGSENYAAPGAHRYSITCDLSTLPVNVDVPEGFYEISQVINGELYKKVDTNQNGYVTEDTLAARTYDESGDYTVEPFTFAMREHRKNYRGDWMPSTEYSLGDVITETHKWTNPVDHQDIREITNQYICSKAGTTGATSPFQSFNPDYPGNWTNYIADGGCAWLWSKSPKINSGYYEPTGKITDIVLTNPGSGYTTSPVVSINGGTPIINAEGVAVLDTSCKSRDYATGEITQKLAKIVINKPGSGYASVPTVEIDPPGGTGTRATAKAVTNIGKKDSLLMAFNNGRAYVRGYKIYKNSTSLLEIPKQRNTSIVKNDYIYTTMGNFMKVTLDSSTTSIPNTLDTLNLYNANNVLIGTCKWLGLSTVDGVYHKLYITDLNVSPSYSAENNIDHVSTSTFKAFVYSEKETALLGNISSLILTKDSSPYEYTLIANKGNFLTGINVGNQIKIENVSAGSSVTADGIVSEIVSDTTLKFYVYTKISISLGSFVGGTMYASENIIGSVVSNTATSSKYCTITGKSTSFMTQLIVGDTIVVKTGSTSNRLYVAAINGQESVSVISQTDISANALAKGTISVVRCNITSTSADRAYFPLSKGRIKTVGDVEFTKNKVISATISGASAVFSPGSGMKAILTGNTNAYFVTKNGLTSAFTPNSVSIDATGKLTIEASIISGASKVFGSISCAPVTSQAKTKTLKMRVLDNLTCTGGIVKLKSGNTTIFDAHRLIKVFQGNTDITDRFELCTGQTNLYYGPSYLQLKNTYSSVDTSSTKLKAVFEYFERGFSGDYYTIDSYVVDSGTDAGVHYLKYEEVPEYNGVSLGSCIDFRPDYDPSATTGTLGMIAINSTIIVDDEEYYLPRRDRICLNTNGDFLDVCGTPSDNPKLPDVPQNAMNIYNLTVGPYTMGIDDVSAEMIDNKRYTMRDIGKLENRIKTLEDYTTLNMLEQKTSTMDIVDANGYDRYKQGFVVDNFTSSTKSVRNTNVNSYSCDETNGILRPSYITREVGFSEYTSDTQNPDLSRAANNYKLWSTKITLPVKDEVEFGGLSDATQTETVNPFLICTYSGSMKLYPESDNWFADSKASGNIHVIDTNDKSYDEYLSNLTYTVWGDWNTSWTGTTDLDVALDTKLDTTTSDNSNYKTTASTTATVSLTETNTINASKSGTQYYGTITSTQQSLGDFVSSSDFVANMRSRNILIKASGLRPNTPYYAYFDDQAVSKYCTPASLVKVKLSGTTLFDDSTSFSTENSNATARVISEAANALHAESTDKTCLSIGEVLNFTNANTSHPTVVTAVLVAKSSTYKDADNNTYINLYVVNEKAGSTVYPHGTCPIWAGDIVTGVTSNATGTVVFAEGNNTYADFASGYATFTANAAGVVTKVPSSSEFYKSYKLESDSTGRLQLLFWIPDKTIDNSAPQFSCGDKSFILSSSNGTKNSWNVTTASATYSATGIQNTTDGISQTIRSIKTSSNIVKEAISTTHTSSASKTSTASAETSFFVESTVVNNTFNTYNAYNSYSYCDCDSCDGCDCDCDGDPLAQTFTLKKCSGGCFVTKVDIFFAEKDTIEPVILQIRPVVNGYPASASYTESEVVKQPEEVKLSTTEVSYTDDNGTAITTHWYKDYDSNNNEVYVPTTFEFADPVYLEDGVEYAIVLMSNSSKYRVWISQIGKEIPNANRVMTEQPTLGSLFKSQNARAWQSEQTQDLLYRIYRARFDTSIVGGVNYTVGNKTTVTLMDNPVETFVNQKYIRVWHTGHGFYNKTTVPTVTLIKSDASGSYNGISASNLFNTPLTVRSMDYNSYYLDIASAATSSGYVGGSNVKVNELWNFDTIRPMISDATFTNTAIGYSMDLRKGVSKDSQTPGSTVVENIKLTQNANNNLTFPCAIGFAGKSTLTDGTDFAVKTQFSTLNANVTPVFSVSRVGMVLVNNLIDDPCYYSGSEKTSYKSIQQIDASIGDITNQIAHAFTDSYGMIDLETEYNLAFVRTNAMTAVAQSDRTISYKIYYTSVVDSSNNPVFDANRFINVVVNSNSAPGSTVSAKDVRERIDQKARFLKVVCEGIAQDGSHKPTNGSLSISMFAELPVLANYETKAVSLSSMSNYLRIMMAVSVPTDADIEVYYKTFNSAQSYSDNVVPWNLVKPSDTINKCASCQTSFQDVSYNIDRLEDFDRFAVKIIMRGNNSASVPMVRDFRVVACV